MRVSFVSVFLAALTTAAIAAPQEQVVATGSGMVPGALVCPDYRAVQAAFRGFSAWRGPRADPEYYGCTLVVPGTVMAVVGEDPGGAPIVAVTLPNGRFVQGVTLRGMVEAFVRKPGGPVGGLRAPAPAQPANAPNPAAKPQAANQPRAAGTIPLPAIHNSPDTLCAPQQQCSDEDFAQWVALLQKRWAMMPDALRKNCQANSTLPAIEKCITSETAAWAKANPNSQTPWMNPDLFGQ